ncbi:hypothetical protein LWI28_001420 [Acer negundo]|uniref:Pentatricopeptide repeat-containing protein n=1 Tax=Acer negundo TaxID=4023 RepID=A0AAD5ITF5_ACENE|nr:hypothetical protein LWI28_001420 [Acer negundo]
MLPRASVKCEELEFDRMSDRKDDVSWNSMISRYIHNELLLKAMDLSVAWKFMHLHDVVVGSALVDMYSKCGRIEYALRFFDMMPIRNVYSWNSMISGYACHGHGDKALSLFSRMKLDGPPPDHVTFVGVLSTCSLAGMVDEGFKHFKSMSQVYGLAPWMEHFSCMADLLGRAGELDKIEDFINKMPIKPNILIWSTVLGACG